MKMMKAAKASLKGPDDFVGDGHRCLDAAKPQKEHVGPVGVTADAASSQANISTINFNV